MEGFNPISLLPLVVIILIFYFLVIRPQNSQRKKHAAMIAELKRGDKVVTNGGFLCEIINQEDQYILVRLGDSSVKLAKDYIAYKVDSITNSKDEKEDDKNAKDKVRNKEISKN